MPGYAVLDSQLKDNNTENVSKYRCPKCRLLLRDAVQPSCGHWLCTGCAVEIFTNKDPHCPRDDCGEALAPEDGQDFFPDRFVRREILAFTVICSFHSLGCPWEGPLSEYEKHRDGCTYAEVQCECGKTMPRTELALHKKTVCPASKKPCPLSKLGCPKQQEMTREELSAHFCETTDVIDHFAVIASVLSSLKTAISDSRALPAGRLPGVVGLAYIPKDTDLTEICQQECNLAISESVEVRERKLGDNPALDLDMDEDHMPEIRKEHFKETMRFPQSQGSQGLPQGGGASNAPVLEDDEEDDLYK